MQFTLNDGVWVRLVDVAGALSARSYTGAGAIVLEVIGRAAAGERRPLARHRCTASSEPNADPDLRLDVAQLGSVYLGGFDFGELARALRVEELTAGAAARADELFRTAHRAVVRGDLLSHGSPSRTRGEPR